MSRKRILLFLALVLPLLVFLFLKFFGKNEFAIPVFYGDKIDSVNSACGTTYTTPYHIPDSILDQLSWQGRPVTLYVIHNLLDQEGMENQARELNRVVGNFPGSIQLATDLEVGNKVHRWNSCVFMIPPKKNLVLVDKEKRIRGYYSIESREESDRLILELEILLKKY